MPAADRERRRAVRLLLAAALPLALTALLLAACGRDRTPEPAAPSTPEAAGSPAFSASPSSTPRGASAQEASANSLDRYLPALKASAHDELLLVEDAPRYTLDVTLDVISRTLSGRGEVLVTNSSREPWNQIVFRLYPNLTHYGGDMSVQGVALDGRPANFTYEDEGTSLRVLLPKPLLPEDQVNVRLAWTTWWPSWVDDNTVYALFGKSQQMVSLPLFYPSLAVYDEGASVGSGAWWRTMGTVRGDAAYNAISLFSVTAVLPSDQVPVTSGTLVLSTTVTPTQTQYTWVTGPSREFLLHMSPVFAFATEMAYGTRVTSYWLPGEEGPGRAALKYGVAALRAFSDIYGDYPALDMRLSPAPLGFRGMEYPQAMLLGVDLYDRMRSNLEILVAHEMAHQWWYQMVHNDPVSTPWLDEGIAEYSVKLYKEELLGQSNADLFQYQRWEIPLETLRTRGSEVQVSGPVESFKNGNQYETIVYGKGALFFDELREELGERQFVRFLQTYLNAHKYQIVTDDDFMAALHVVGKPELLRLYRDWVGESALQAIQPAPASP